MKEQITEQELVLPSLYLMYLRRPNSITTTELIQLLTSIMHPVGRDAAILGNRNDTYFSQKVRNLKCHNKLEKQGYAVYDGGAYNITDKGCEFVKQHEDCLRYLFSQCQNFSTEDVLDSLKSLEDDARGLTFNYDEIISEGESNFKLSKHTNRSIKLRNAAIEHFSKGNVIVCECCGFEFKSFYGEKYGAPCIEIHHLRPIFQYEGVSETQTIYEALKNLMPVCPNCHRVIHKNNITASMICDFKQYIKDRHITSQCH